MIGLSLSFCVSDILRGKVQEEQVSLIITGTRCVDDAAFEYCLSHYAANYWRMAPEQGRAIAQKLWDQGKIFEPRVYNRDAELNIADGHWVHANQQPELELK